MCVAAPGKILSINGTTATVHAGLVIQVLSESQAQEINNLLAELETLL
jgi:hydrogenase maturation factor